MTRMGRELLRIVKSTGSEWYHQVPSYARLNRDNIIIIRRIHCAKVTSVMSNVPYLQFLGSSVETVSSHTA